MSRIQKTIGTVIRIVDYGDSDQILSVLTPDRGKLSFMAKGARKSSQRFGGAVDLLTQSEFVFYDREGLKSLNQATLVNAHSALQTDYDRLTTALRCARTINRLLEDDQEATDVFELFERLLRVLSSDASVETLGVYELAFKLKLMLRLGWAPILDVCANCGKDPQTSWFSMTMGGVLCEDCHRGDRSDEIPLSPGAARSLHMALKLPFDKLGRLRLSSAIVETGTRIVDGFIAHHLRPLMAYAAKTSKRKSSRRA